LTGDDDPLDLVGAFKDLHDLGFAHQALDREVRSPTIPVSAGLRF
jgi:hypothetical protein